MASYSASIEVLAYVSETSVLNFDNAFVCSENLPSVSVWNSENKEALA